MTPITEASQALITEILKERATGRKDLDGGTNAMMAIVKELTDLIVERMLMPEPAIQAIETYFAALITQLMHQIRAGEELSTDEAIHIISQMGALVEGMTFMITQLCVTKAAEITSAYRRAQDPNLN